MSATSPRPGARSQGSWRRMALAVFLPTAVYEVGVGAVTPIVALDARGLGGSPAAAGLVVALLGIGQIVGDIPAGVLAARFGDRRAMVVGALASVGLFATCAAARTWAVLLVAIFLLGAINAVFMLARQSYLTEITPPLARARAFSTLGGVARIGMLVGPFIGAGIIEAVGIHGAYWLAAATSVAAAVIVTAVRDPDADGPATDPNSADDAGPATNSRPATNAGSAADAGPATDDANPADDAGPATNPSPADDAGRAEGASSAGPAPRPTTRSLLRDHRGVLGTLGIGIACVSAVRMIRYTALPLWAESIGLSASLISLIVAISGVVDTALFYPAGKFMDLKGRSWVACPSMIILSLGIMALPVAHTAVHVAIVAAVMGLGNGIGSGIVMTTGADVAPVAGRAQFLALWRLLSDSGSAVGPVMVSGITAVASLGVAIVSAGTLGLVGAAILAITLPMWNPHANATTRRAAGIVPPARRRRPRA